MSVTKEQQLLSSQEPQTSWIYDDIYNCFKREGRKLYVRQHDDHKKYRIYQQVNDTEDYYVCMTCGQRDAENDDEEYTYRSRAHCDDGLIYGEAHEPACSPYSFESRDRATRLTTAVSEATEWHYHNVFKKFQIINDDPSDAGDNNNGDAIQVINDEGDSFMFKKCEDNEFKCENCRKYGWTTCAKIFDDNAAVKTQSHHPLCLPKKSSP